MKTWRCRTTPGNSSALRPSRRLLILSGAVVLFAVGPGPAAGDPGDAAARPRRLPAGERLTFQGRWLAFHVGSGWVEVKKDLVTVAGRPAYHIEAQAMTNDVLSAFYPIHDVLHSYVDAETLRPLRAEKDQREGRYRAREVVTFDHAAGTGSYESLLNGSHKTFEISTAFEDLLSAIYWFRAQPLAAAQDLSVTLYTDEKLYDTKVAVEGPEPLELLKRGTFPCFRVEPKAAFKGVLVKRARLWAYFTADERRLPLLIKATTPWGPMSAVLDLEADPG
jgi:hypothetical protein